MELNHSSQEKVPINTAATRILDYITKKLRLRSIEKTAMMTTKLNYILE